MFRLTFHRWMAVALVLFAAAAVLAVLVGESRTEPPPARRTTALMRFARAESLERTEPETAVAELKELLAEAPDYPGAHLLLGRTLWAMQRPADALEPLRAAVKMEPDDSVAQPILGRALLEVNGSLMDAETADALFAALRLDPRADSPIARFITDQLQREPGLANPQKAHPTLLALCCRLGESYLSRGQLPNALFAFGDVLKAVPNHPAALDGQARTKAAIAAIRAKTDRP